MCDQIAKVHNFRIKNFFRKVIKYKLIKMKIYNKRKYVNSCVNTKKIISKNLPAFANAQQKRLLHLQIKWTFYFFFKNKRLFYLPNGTKEIPFVISVCQIAIQW